MIKTSQKAVLILLSVKNISKSYGSTKAVENVSLDLQQGECFGLVGPNGAGKSTLIKIIVGMIHPDEGTVQFDSSISKDWKQQIGYVPQEVSLEEKVSALQNLYYFGKIYNLKGRNLQERAEEVLSYIGLTERKTEKVKTFSGGMKRRLNIGCALMNQPRVIIMDEPTVGVDPQSRRYILNLIEKMKKENRTIIYSSHYIEEIEKTCDEVAFIDHGAIIEQNKIENLLQSYAVPAVFFTCKDNDALIQEIQSLGSVSPHNNGYTLTTRNPMQAMEKILQVCKKHAIVLDQFEFMQPKLEDVFFSLTG